MKKFYIIDDNGDYSSEDGKIHYTLLQGKELYNYLKSTEGSKKSFFIYKDSDNDYIGIEIPNNIVKISKQSKNHSDYLKYHEEKSGFVTVSIDTVAEVENNSDIYSHELILEDDIFEKTAKHMDLEVLEKALLTLNEEERDIINALYLSEDTISEREYARLHGLPDMTVNYRKNNILKKLKKFF